MCREIARNVETIIASMKELVEFEKTSDLERMLYYGVHSTHSPIIDGEIVSISKPLSTDDIAELLSRQRGN